MPESSLAFIAFQFTVLNSFQLLIGGAFSPTINADDPMHWVLD